jgi:NDP-sugar pyrophosphorylase family protein
MNHKTCLILSAGFGTRMGSIGKELPKPLWPIYEKTILELQVLYAEKLGSEKIFINIHHGHEKFRDFSNKNVEIIHEPDILGSGGAIHNLIPKIGNKTNSLIYIAGDQFYFFEEEIFQKGFERLKDYNAVLFSMNAKAGTHYGKLKIEDEELKDIEKCGASGHSEDYTTFSGLGILNLDTLNYQQGYSDFFDTVADYKNKKILVLNPREQDYWDFGTYDFYFLNMFRLLGAHGKFYDFCIENQALLKEKIDLKKKTYGMGDGSDFINLMDQDLSKGYGNNSIIMNSFNQKNSFKGPGIYFEDLFQKIILS